MFPTGFSCEGKAYVQFASKASAEALRDSSGEKWCAKVDFIGIIWQ